MCLVSVWVVLGQYVSHQSLCEPSEVSRQLTDLSVVIFLKMTLLVLILAVELESEEDTTTWSHVNLSR